jgi:SulP family sulfate permease
LGSVIRFIPYPLVVGFTTGIALIILFAQVKDFLGLRMGTVPADFIDKCTSYASHIGSVNGYALTLASGTAAIIFLWPKIMHKIPGSLVAIIAGTLIVYLFHLPVETIGQRFGNIPSSLPAPTFPSVDFATIKDLVQPAFTIALLAGIESLLSAVVADGMTGGNHRSNTELIAQGAGNIFSSLFGGIPATGAIARTATNIKNGATTPVAGMVHAITLLLIVLFAGKWAAWIPMPVLAGILVVVAYNMSEIKNFISILKGPRSDIAVLLTTFLLTVLIDLTVAIEIGMLLAVLLFIRRIIRLSNVKNILADEEAPVDAGDKDLLTNLPDDIEIFEISGPLFFGAAYKFKDAIRQIKKRPRVLIIRMRMVPVIDATGIKTLEEIYHDAKRHGTKMILAEVNSKQVMAELKSARLLFSIGKANVTTSFASAMVRCKEVYDPNKSE